MIASPYKTALYTFLALLAFAGNSVLCRLALGNEQIDAASFTAIRLLSGVLVLFCLLAVAGRSKPLKSSPSQRGSWWSGFMLFGYAITFSFAYVTLETGIGALILFGAVQITMIVASLVSGDRLHKLEWAGMVVAFVGFIYLVLPTLSTPSWLGFVLMTISGMAWAFYTLAGRGSVNPLQDTGFNFLRTIPLVILLLVASAYNANLTLNGLVLAALSGGVASGIGYTLWYSALKGMSTTQAAVVQLLVPVIAAIGGVVFVDEPFSLRLMISSALVLGGILTVVLSKHRFTNSTSA
ncbi:DMT family transporter [Vibrio tapetis subsp. quintayensis]|uniref:DMT family transporter n=1 Tax=Vibrio tapetis TaxID=52443 RepID=UPI0025B2D31E|nr:DMT family transporter [Vibrio tapetis]MDN3681817.1 DMT family transporter [Vibrio tapetis subsp. quintayensis]